jgi:hypothetical protein
MVVESLLHLAGEVKGNGRLKIRVIRYNRLNQVEIERIMPGRGRIPGNGRGQINRQLTHAYPHSGYLP